MKLLKYFLLISILLVQTSVYAAYHDRLIGDIQYDWIGKTDLEREAIVNEVHDIVFENDIEEILDLKTQYAEQLKDANYKEHYLAAAAGYKDYKDFNISAFYLKNQKHIYAYALQNKKDVSKIYYYDALGHLRFIDFVNGEYPDYPYYSIQYKINGKPVSAIYFIAKDTQYMYNPDGTFKGLWYKNYMYDGHGKMIMKRTAY